MACADHDHLQHLRDTLLDLIAARDVPAVASACSGEVVHVGRYVRWLLSWDQPTLTALIALLEAPLRGEHSPPVVHRPVPWSTEPV